MTVKQSRALVDLVSVIVGVAGFQDAIRQWWMGSGVAFFIAVAFGFLVLINGSNLLRKTEEKSNDD